MKLNAIQQSAFRVLEEACDSKIEGTLSENASNTSIDDDVKKIKSYAQRTQSGNPQEMTMGAVSDYIDLKSLITPTTRKQLETLRDYSNQPDNADQSIKEAAIEAYNSLSKDIKNRLVKALVEKGIVSVVSSVPKLAFLAVPISKILASPITTLAVSLSDECLNLQHRLINSALKMMGRPEIDSESKDLFMAKLIGSFADQILATTDRGQNASFTSMIDANAAPAMATR
jgi:hypothetical protein